MDKSFDAAAVEARVSALWEETGAFRSGRPERRDAKPFCVVIPPPNVTGNLHMGHALNNTLQDILCRYRRMNGEDVLWQPGTDHAGIATQMVVEQKARRGAGARPAGDGPRGVPRARLGVEGRIGRGDRPAAQAARRLLRLEPRALHSRRRAVARGRQGLRPALSRGAHLQGQATGQLGPEVPDGDLGPGSRPGRVQGLVQMVARRRERRSTRRRWPRSWRRTRTVISTISNIRWWTRTARKPASG